MAELGRGSSVMATEDSRSPALLTLAVTEPPFVRIATTAVRVLVFAGAFKGMTAEDVWHYEG